MFRPPYYSRRYVLDPNLYKNRAIEDVLIGVDGIYVDFTRTDANLANVEVSIDKGDWVTLASSPAFETNRVFTNLRIRWSSSEDGKTVAFVMTGEARLRIIPPFTTYTTIVGSSINVPVRIATSDIMVPIDIQGDMLGLARDTTVQTLIANDYNLLSLDLGTARTDALIESNVISFCIADATSGATYSIKLFSTAKPAIDQSIAKPGFCLERLNKANLYLTNTAQTGYTLKILVLKRV